MSTNVKRFLMSAAGGAEHWWSYITDSGDTTGYRPTSNEGNNSHTCLSDGSVVTCGFDDGSPGNPGKYGRVVKLNSDGTLAWETRIGNTLEAGDRGYNLTSITSDSSDNVYTIGRYYYGDDPYCVVKLNGSTGALLLQDEFEHSGNFFLNKAGHLGVCSSSKGGLVIAGEIQDGTVDSTCSVMIHDITDMSNELSKDVYTDPALNLGNEHGGWVSNNSVWVMARPWNSGNSKAHLQKFTIGSGGTSLTQDYGKQYYPNGYTHRSRAVCSKPDDSLVVVFCDFQGFSGSTGTRDQTLMILNSGGNPSYISSFENGGNNSPNSMSKVRIDSNDNIYLFTYISGEIHLLKYNSTLQKQYHQKITVNSDWYYLMNNNLEIDDNDNLCLGFIGRLTVDTKFGTVIMKLPNDGSITGTFGGITIANVTSGWTYRDQMSTAYMNSSSVSYANDTRSTVAQNHFTSSSGLSTLSVEATEPIA